MYISLGREVAGLDKNILGRQNSTNRPSVEEIKAGQYGRSRESKRKSGKDGAAEGVSKGKTRGTSETVLEFLGFIPQAMRSR